MQLVFSSPNLSEATLIKDALEREGLHCMVKNEVLSGGGFGLNMGFTNTWPEVWILDDKDLEKAQEIVKVWSPQE